jgi:predicted metal-binding protein
MERFVRQQRTLPYPVFALLGPDFHRVMPVFNCDICCVTSRCTITRLKTLDLSQRDELYLCKTCYDLSRVPKGNISFAECMLTDARGCVYLKHGIRADRVQLQTDVMLGMTSGVIQEE